MTISLSGFSFDSSNQLLVTTSAVDSNSKFVNGFAFDSTGNLHVSDATPAAGSPYNMGLAFKTTGELYVSTATPSSPYHSGLFNTTSDGRVYMGQAGTVAFYKNGIGFTSTGAVVATGLNPIPGLSPAAYYKFNTGITVTGSGVSQWDDQSGNGRHLLQATDAARPPKQADGSILFDGATQYLKASAFTLNQPVTVYLRFKQVSWTGFDVVFDGNTASVTRLLQSGATPTLGLNAGAAFTNANLAVGSYGSVACVLNGASSSILIDQTSEAAGNAGANNPAGFTLGARGDGAANFSNIQAKECAIFAAAHDATTRASVIAYLSTL